MHIALSTAEVLKAGGDRMAEMLLKINNALWHQAKNCPQIGADAGITNLIHKMHMNNL